MDTREFVCQTDYCFQSSDGSIARCLTVVPQNTDQHPWTANINFSSNGNYFLDASYPASGRYNTFVEDKLLSFQFRKEYLKIEPVVSSGLPENALNFDRGNFSHDLQINMNVKKPYQFSCSSGEDLPFGGASFVVEEGFESLIDRFKSKQRRVLFDERDDVLETDASNPKVLFYVQRVYGRMRHPVHKHVPKLMRKGGIPTGFDLLSGASPKIFPF